MKPIQDLITKEKLEDLYIKQELTTREIAAYFNVGQTTIRHYMAKFGIKARTSSEYFNQTTAGKIKKAKMNEKNRQTLTKNRGSRTCKYCKKKFKLTANNKNNKYCSKKCAANALKKAIAKQYCIVCGKEIIITNGKNYKRKYCKACNKLRVKTQQRKRVTVKCACCGKELEVIKSRIKQNRNIFCDAKCMAVYFAANYTGENSPT